MNIEEINKTYKDFTKSFQSVVLASVDELGEPHASYASFVQDDERTIYVYLSDIARHSQNLKKTQKASALFLKDESQSEEIFARQRLTYDCSVALIPRGGERFQSIAQRFDEKFADKVKGYHSMKDFNIYALTPKKGLLVLGFGQAYGISGDDLSTITHMTGPGGKGHTFTSKPS